MRENPTAPDCIPHSPRAAQVRSAIRIRIALFWIVALAVLPLRAQPAANADPLVSGLRPVLEAASGAESYRLRGRVDFKVGGDRHVVECDLVRHGDESFDLTITHADYAVSLRRRADATAFALPKHGVVYHGKGDVHQVDRLAPAKILDRLVTPRTSIAPLVPLVTDAEPETLALALRALFGAKRDADSARWKLGDRIALTFPEPGAIELVSGDASVRLAASSDVPAPDAVDAWPGLRPIELDRFELERHLARGVRRALEILAPGPTLTQPSTAPRRVAHGELRWIDGQRVAILEGTPEQIGRAHGELLRDEAIACIDSVLYAFGTAQTIRSGKWFPRELMDAYSRLKSHIPERHAIETRALARALEMDETLVEAVNVFPEMFHCSGFALFGKATRDGKLYHGRVLDYMTEIGLQDAATTFIVRVDDRIAFANIGYAAFIGCVSGMNAKSVSLGEMGGGGEGHWDGVPMATLMRRALEECGTLDDVIALWRESPRTCEYYYVFADGKSRRAVGVAALPESIEFIQPGQSHPRLGDGIEDAVVLSSGDRLATLRERVTSRHGAFDVELGQWLMTRPVAMASNLHNVLFVPEDGVLYVSNADHAKCAAERPYARIDLTAILNERSTIASSGGGKESGETTGR
ncbi:MAG: peptidase C45 acyl-coenzyme A:6-aminopenicillanic acid acyl-transferase [Planctomycetes bacterium]|nr:peptidase C45 acyl-coenzyme A:6-aminopenicillanic acid acyl-transferase [Planctomycetota bacterium]